MIDNQLYDRMAGSWWDESGFLHVLQALNPVRLDYLRRALSAELAHGRRTLDLGCGGGLLAEELARLGCDVTGVDPSEASLAAARAHAAAVGLPIDYRRGTGEELPFPDASFDLTCCCDVLEHVRDLPRVIAEVARVLRPGGIFFYDTINRTLRSRLVVIKLFQEWPSTRFMPPDLHDWQLFIKPGELLALLASNGLESRGVTGLKPRANPLRTLRILRARQRGELSYREAVERIGLEPSRDESILYMGYAVRSGGAIA